MKLDELGTHYPIYHPTFDFAGKFIDSTHRQLANSVDQATGLVRLKTRRWLGKVIPGWLRPEDALKIYEIAYFAQGDILELGSYYGLSTGILSMASEHAPYRKNIYSVDLDPKCVAEAHHNLHIQNLDRQVAVICAEAAAAVKQFASDHKRFGFVFIDHSHAYESVKAVCQELHTVVASGGFCLFHDFNDPRNKDSAENDYGVYQAVTEGLTASRFEFWGIYGCTALYRAM
jgi:predicted O-methyltransferase YrrM